MSAGVQHRKHARSSQNSRQIRLSACDSQENSRQHLSETLKRASQIVATKAKKARTQEVRDQRCCTVAGTILILLGILGAVAATVSGLAQTLGVFSTIGVGVASVGLGALVLSSTPGSKTPTNSYAIHALELAQMSAALRA